MMMKISFEYFIWKLKSVNDIIDTILTRQEATCSMVE